jgi:hypothetical protein
MSIKIEDIRFSSSSIDEFFSDLNPQPRVASKKVRVSGLQHLAGFEFISDDKLVRLSKKDFWQLGEDGDGYYIERLVNDDGGPVSD